MQVARPDLPEDERGLEKISDTAFGRARRPSEIKKGRAIADFAFMIGYGAEYLMIGLASHELGPIIKNRF